MDCLTGLVLFYLWFGQFILDSIASDEIDGLTNKTKKINDLKFHAWKHKIVLNVSLDKKKLKKINKPNEKLSKNGWKTIIRHRLKLYCRFQIGTFSMFVMLKLLRKVLNATMNFFERHNLLVELSARSKFHTVAKYNGEKMLTHQNCVRIQAVTLKSRDVQIDSQELAMAALSGLLSMQQNLILDLDKIGNDK